MFTREDTSSFPVPETMLNGPEEERLGQLVVTPELTASKINNMKENKSPGVDGISPYSVLYVVCYVLRSPLSSICANLYQGMSIVLPLLILMSQANPHL